jgi:hypothetical protein
MSENFKYAVENFTLTRQILIYVIIFQIPVFFLVFSGYCLITNNIAFVIRILMWNTIQLSALGLIVFSYHFINSFFLKK